MVSDYVLLALLWGAYCAVHSALISIPVTNWFRKVLAGGYRFYRLSFNIFSLITLVPLVMYSQSAPFHSEPLFAWGGYWGIVRYSLVGLGVLLFVAGACHYSMLQFLGVNQIRKASVGGAIAAGGDLDDSGVLGLVRHPWDVADRPCLRTSAWTSPGKSPHLPCDQPFSFLYKGSSLAR